MAFGAEDTFELLNDSPFSQANFPVNAYEKKMKRMNSDDVWLNSQFSETLDNRFYQKSLQNNSIVNTRPVFRLVNQDKKQTVYHMLADFTYTRDIEKVEFVVWGDQENFTDRQKYTAALDSTYQVWKADVPIENHKLAGRYQVLVLATNKNGRCDEIEFGEFEVKQPTISAKLDPARADKGQFDLLMEINSAADVETIDVPVWSKEDKSDLKVYRGQQKSPTTYNIRMDYEDFDFQNGIYSSEAFFTSQNGLSAQSEMNQVEINLILPKRVRVLQDTIIYQDRALNEGGNSLERNSMLKVEGIVYNEEQKIFKTPNGYISADNLEVSEKSEDVRFVSHRGNSRVAPENSLPAFQQATTWGVETDVRLTKDRQWVIMHDDSVDRMTNGSGLISELTLAEINQLRIDNGRNVESYDQSQLIVPTLEDYLATIQYYQRVPLIDLKPTDLTAEDYDSLAYLIDSYGFGENGMVISFDYRHLQEIKQRLPNIHVQLLSDELNEQLIADVYHLGNNAGLDIRYDSIISQVDLVTQAQSLGLKINAWTIPKKEWKQAEKIGVDFITAKTGPKNSG
ncbi:glycerophosphodiester phosphodiesterase family protein [Candidatus Enterococcus ferrettii]|uniref:Glycerophosphoryl diester phosphodiesterase n=1 Tax=Candidatus Enterococcus ferrettii TaxID=2815324 RepID=A0ABV0EZY5_9ENTE|nr:glycerophosphodiester phosphodiesterase family protein [Enterococcus sp. 665A]MBO1340876.1 GBS Bsp-like repeat-containing protein [Enterococcus sp. 665A]